MADYRAIHATCEAVVALLRQAYDPALFDAAASPLQFRVFNAAAFGTPISAGVTLFLYRVQPNITLRTPPGRLNPDGLTRRRRQVPVELHFLLTAWGEDASLEQTILGWMVRTMEDTPVLGAPLLNGVVPDVFGVDETVEIAFGQLSNEELFRVWEVLPETTFRLSIPYIARLVRIDSTIDDASGAPVRRRDFDLAVVKD